MVYAPKNFRLTDAKIFTLKAGSELSGADIVIPVAAFHTVSGMAESADGHTLNAGSLTLSDDKDKTHSFRGSVGSDGQFHFLYVPEGSYTLAYGRSHHGAEHECRRQWQQSRTSADHDRAGLWQCDTERAGGERRPERRGGAGSAVYAEFDHTHALAPYWRTAVQVLPASVAPPILPTVDRARE